MGGPPNQAGGVVLKDHAPGQLLGPDLGHHQNSPGVIHGPAGNLVKGADDGEVARGVSRAPGYPPDRQLDRYRR